jgi:hypothetical protein
MMGWGAHTDAGCQAGPARIFCCKQGMSRGERGMRSGAIIKTLSASFLTGSRTPTQFNASSPMMAGHYQPVLSIHSAVVCESVAVDENKTRQKLASDRMTYARV